MIGKTSLTVLMRSSSGIKRAVLMGEYDGTCVVLVVRVQAVPCRLTVSPPRSNCAPPVPHTALGSDFNQPPCARPTQRKRGGRMRIPAVSVQRSCRPGSLRQSAASLRLFGAATAIGSEATPQGAVVEARREPLPLERPRGTRSPLLEE